MTTLPNLGLLSCKWGQHPPPAVALLGAWWTAECHKVARPWLRAPAPAWRMAPSKSSLCGLCGRSIWGGFSPPGPHAPPTQLPMLTSQHRGSPSPSGVLVSAEQRVGSLLVPNVSSRVSPFSLWGTFPGGHSSRFPMLPPPPSPLINLPSPYLSERSSLPGPREEQWPAARLRDTLSSLFNPRLPRVSALPGPLAQGLTHALDCPLSEVPKCLLCINSVWHLMLFESGHHGCCVNMVFLLCINLNIERTYLYNLISSRK